MREAHRRFDHQERYPRALPLAACHPGLVWSPAAVGSPLALYRVILDVSIPTLMLSSVTAVLKDATLSQVGGVWTLRWRGREYMRLLDANSREHAEQQIAEMLFVRATPHSASNAAANSVAARSSADTTWPSRADLQYLNSDMMTAVHVSGHELASAR